MLNAKTQRQRRIGSLENKMNERKTERRTTQSKMNKPATFVTKLQRNGAEKKVLYKHKKKDAVGDVKDS